MIHEQRGTTGLVAIKDLGKPRKGCDIWSLPPTVLLLLGMGILKRKVRSSVWLEGRLSMG